MVAAPGQAAATSTALCKAAQAWCAEGNQYAAKTPLQASSGKATIAVKFGEGTIKANCTGSTLSGETNAQSGAPLSIALSGWSLSGCAVGQSACTATAQSLPYTGSLAWTKGSEGALTISAGGAQPRVHLLCKTTEGATQVDCTYSFEPTLDFAGGVSAQLVASSEPMTKAGPVCPGSSPTFTATYSVSSPQPAYVAKPAATTVCKAAQAWCVEASQSPAETPLEAAATSASIAVKYAGGTIKASCTGSTLKGKTTAKSGAPLPVEISAWTLSGCAVAQSTCTSTAQGLPYAGSLAWTKANDGALALGGAATQPAVHLLCKTTEGVTQLDCTYSFKPQLDVVGGTTAQIVANKEPMSKAGPLCIGSEPTFTATYSVSAPQPLYVAKPSSGSIPLPTTITEDMTLVAGSPYTGTSVTIEPGVTVVAEPGVMVKLTGALAVKGTLRVNGTAEEPVIFTSLSDSAPGQWTGIVLQAGAGASILSHAEVRYAKTGIAISGGISPEITESVIRDNSIIGISASIGDTQIVGNALYSNGTGIIVAGKGSPEIAENTIEDCSGYGISRTLAGNDTGEVSIHDNVVERCGSPTQPSIQVLAGEANSVLTGTTLADNLVTDGSGRAISYYANSFSTIPPDIDDNVLTGNASNALWVAGKVAESSTWENRGFPIIPHDSHDLRVASGATLVLDSGLVLKLAAPGAEIYVQGELIAEGTESEPVTFTSIKDDSVGGDTNGDGAATQAAPGDWKGVTFANGTQNTAPGRGVLAFVDARYGAHHPTCHLCGDDVMFRFGSPVSTGPSSPSSSIRNSRFAYASGIAIGGDGALFEITDNSFKANGSAISISSAGSPEITGNSLSSNGKGIIVAGNGSPHIAENTIEDCSGYGISRTLSGNETGDVSIHDNLIERCGSPTEPSIQVLAGETNSTLAGLTLANNAVMDGGGRAISYYANASSTIPPDIDENAIIGNASNALWVAGKLAESSTWENRGFPIVPQATHDLRVASEATLTLKPGLVLKPSAPGAEIYVQGELIAEGTESEPVTFTSIKDDTIGGDTNNDDAATQPAPGDWGGLVFPSASGDEFSHLAFHYAETAIDIQYLSSMFIANSDFVYNEAAFEVAGTADNNPALGALSCVFPYTSFVMAYDVWFGEGGYPSPSMDIGSVVGAVIPEEYAPLFGAMSSMASVSAPLFGKGDTVPFSIYSCPALGIPPTPVTPVIVTSIPPEPWFTSL